METAKLSKTAKRLSNEKIGVLQRRLNEIVRRVEEGTVELKWVMEEMQRVVEGRRHVIQYGLVTPLEFKRPTKRERRKSKASVSQRLPHYIKRLDYPKRTPEHIMAEMFEAECIPCQQINHGATPINAIMGTHNYTDHDVMVITSTLQWLGTNIGGEFLTRFIRSSRTHL